VPRRSDLPTLAAFAGTVVLGSANIVAVRFSNRELEPLWGAGVRFVIASSVLCTIGLVTRRPFPRGISLRGAVSFGLFAFTGAYALFYLGAVRVSAGTVGVIMALVPLLTLLLAAAQRIERFSWRGVAPRGRRHRRDPVRLAGRRRPDRVGAADRRGRNLRITSRHRGEAHAGL